MNAFRTAESPREKVRVQASFLSLILGMVGVALACGDFTVAAVLSSLIGFPCSIYGLTNAQAKPYAILGLMLNGYVLITSMCLFAFWWSIWRAMSG